jgi:hypothetical protein
LYLAMRSVRESEPVLICMAFSSHGDVRDGGVFGLAGAVRNDSWCSAARLAISTAAKRFGQRADLVDLDQDRVGDALLDAFA